jgi:hypothetical protein
MNNILLYNTYILIIIKIIGVIGGRIQDNDVQSRSYTNLTITPFVVYYNILIISTCLFQYVIL